MSKLNTSNNDANSLLHKKRRNIFKESIEESVKFPKKYNSEETKKKNKYIHFIAEIDKNYDENKADTEEKLKGDELNIKMRSQKAIDIIKSIKSENA